MIQGKFRVIDAHCHVYPDKIAEKAVEGTKKFYNVSAFGDGTVSGLIRECGKAGSDHFIVQSVATTPKQVARINAFIADEVEKNPALLTGLGTLHPDSEDIEGDVANLLTLGLKGVKLHPDMQGFKLDDYRCLKIYEECEKNHLPIIVHMGDYRYDLSTPERLLAVMGIYTDLIVIAAHLGGWSGWERACELLHGTPNLYYDCSSSLYGLTKEMAEQIIRTYGTDRVLYGTDYPMWDPAVELSRFLNLDFTDEEKEAILFENAAKLFGISI